MDDVTFQPITVAAAHALATWRYPAPYDTYDIGDEPAALAEMLDTRSPWFVAFDADGEPMGYCCFGTAAEVGWEGESRLWTLDDGTLSVGLGLRPDLTGQHLGLPFFDAVLAFAAQRFSPTRSGSSCCRSISGPSASTSAPDSATSARWIPPIQDRTPASFWRCAVKSGRNLAGTTAHSGYH